MCIRTYRDDPPSLSKKDLMILSRVWKTEYILQRYVILIEFQMFRVYKIFNYNNIIVYKFVGEFIIIFN